jgi:hypothetical protein
VPYIVEAKIDAIKPKCYEVHDGANDQSFDAYSGYPN